MISFLTGLLCGTIGLFCSANLGAQPALTVSQGGTGTSTMNVSQLLYGAATSTIKNVATTSLTINAPLTTSGTAGALVGGTNLTIDIDDIKAADLDLTDITLNDFTNDAGFITSASTAYDAWTHPQVGTSATTSGMIFTAASSTFTQGLSILNGTTTNATSTNLNVSATVDFDTYTSAILLTGAGGILAEYTGTTCTNQFVRVLSALGVATCATVGTADVAGLDISDDTNLTGGLGLTLTGDDMACDTASGSVFGCLAAADWTTFNSKLGNYDAWTHPTTITSATTSGMVFNSASSTFTTLLNIANASTTQITMAGSVWITPLTSAILLTDSAGLLAEYAGTSCTNQFVRSLSALGAATCATVSLTADVTGDLPFANLAQVSANSVLGNITGATADAASVATSSLFTWSPAFSTTGTVKNVVERSFTYSTTTWTGTTTIPLLQSSLASTIDGVRCKTYTSTNGDAGGTLNIQFGKGSASTTLLNASSTNNYNAFSSNNTVTAGDSWVADIGTPASSPRLINCTYKFTI